MDQSVGTRRQTCWSNSGACAGPPPLHSRRICATGATPPAWRSASRTRSTSLTAAPVSASLATILRGNMTPSPCWPTSSSPTFTGTTSRASPSSAHCTNVAKTASSFIPRVGPVIYNESGHAEFDKKVRKLAEGADILIYDAQYLPEEYEAKKRGWGHSHWREAVNIVMESGAKDLVLYHHDPDHTDLCIDAIVKEARNYYPRVRAASEGMEMTL